MRVTTFLTALTIAGVCWAGIRPRADSAEYRNHETQYGVTLAAERVPANQVRSTFATDLTRDYVVLEIAVYPGSAALDLTSLDFSLRCGNQIVRAGNPTAIAARRQEQNAPRRSDVDIHPTVGVGYESSNDPYSGRRKGVHTTAGVDVGTGGWNDPRPASTDRDRQTMEQELEEQQLPTGPVRAPVAGYLYFPFPANKQKSVAYELEYNGPMGRIRLAVK